MSEEAVSDEIMHVTDWLTTILHAAGVSEPADRGDRRPRPLRLTSSPQRTPNRLIVLSGRLPCCSADARSNFAKRRSGRGGILGCLMSEEYAISPENIVRGLFEAASRRDFGTALDAFDQNVVMVVVPDAFPTAAGTYLGREEVGKWFAEWFRSFADDYRFEVEELRSVAERVFVVARHHGRGRASGVEVRGLFAYVYTVRLAKIVRVEIFRDRDEALDALGREK